MSKRIDVSPISGFPEWKPGERLVEQRLMDTIRGQFELFGFAPIETPAVERLAVLTAKGGIQRQIYSVGRPAAEEESGPDLGLHFDLTVPLARYVAQRSHELAFPFRRYQMQKVWRGERAQRGRFREFYQCDIDIIGSGSLDLLHDAEIARVISAVFEALALPGFRVHVSNRKVLTALLAAHDVRDANAENALRLVDKSGPDGPDAVRGSLSDDGYDARLVDAIGDLLTAETLSDARAILERSQADVTGVDELQSVEDAAEVLGMPREQFRVDLGIARGLDYYTGTVYETFVAGHEDWGSVCSGGRYDDLAGYFTSRQLPGVGVSIGLTRLFDLLLRSDLVDGSRSTPAEVLITVQDRERHLLDYLSLANTLRSAGIATEVYLQGRRLGDQLSYASATGVPVALIAGSDEFGREAVTLRRMSDGEQHEAPISGVVDAVRGLLGAMAVD